MCGIVGYAGKTNVIKNIMTGLKSLEYRGYDSSGIAYLDKNNNIKIYKKVGQIKNLDQILNYEDEASLGISHTRWATHGGVTDTNAHPHNQGKITLVHNGIIENYEEIKKELEKEGYNFKSSTDSEVAAVLIDKLYKENRIAIPKSMAGLMLSGILSDTLILTSPTTTDIDKEAVSELGKLAKVDYKVYGGKMIKAGSSLKGMTREQVLYKDYKTYTIDNSKIGLGQVITMDIDEVMSEKDEYVSLLNTVCESNNYLFVCLFITNILENGTYVLFSDRAKEVLESSFSIKNIKQGEFLKGIVSRKKQILPVLMNDMD